MNRQVRPQAAEDVLPLMGNEAIARGAWEAGVRVAAAYPGTPSTEILELLGRYPASDLYAEWSTNEKVALDVAIGAALSGVRAIACMKHVGLNVAADSLMSQSYIGAHAGLVLVVCDDPGIHSSQNEQDTRLFARFAGVPVLEPSDAQEARDFTRLAFELSEAFDTPVIVRSTTRLSHTRSAVRVGQRVAPPSRGFVDAPGKTVTIPANARRLHPKLIEREAKLAAYFETSPLTRWEKGDRRFGVVTGSTSYLYVKEVARHASILKLGAAYPLPERTLRAFAASVDRLLVIEELEPALETAIRAMGLPAEGKVFFPRLGELSPELVRSGLAAAGLAEAPPAPVTLGIEPMARPPVLCAGCPHTGAYLALRGLDARVAGDIGCYTLAAVEPLRSIDTTVCMGASIGNAVGMAAAGEKKPIVATIGDFDLPALRHPAVDRRRLQPSQRHSRHPRQCDHRHDRRAGPSRHRTDAARGAGAEGRLRGDLPRRRGQLDPACRSLRRRPHVPDAARGDRAQGRLGRDLRTSLCARSGQDQRAAAHGDAGRLCRLPVVHEPRLPGADLVRTAS